MVMVMVFEFRKEVAVNSVSDKRSWAERNCLVR